MRLIPFLTGGACAACAVVLAASRAVAQRRSPAAVMQFRPTAGTDAQGSRGSRGRHPARHREAAKERVDVLSRRKQDFLGLLSHELRNPLSAINVALAVMRSRDSLETGQQARRVVERQVAHITRLVDDLVDTARIERGTLSLELEQIDLRDVLATSVEMMRPSVAHRRQLFVWAPSPQPLPINGDRVRLQQVFSNLLLNASKYTPDEGQIELLTYRAESDVCVEVRDNGRGIPPEAMDKVFEPFVRAARDESGLGIGLYVSRTLVEGHGGEITVTSTGAHAGATFTVRLPEFAPLLQQLSG